MPRFLWVTLLNLRSFHREEVPGARRRPRGLYGILQTPEAWPPARLKEVALARASLYRAGGLAVGRETGRSSCKRREGRQRVDRQSGPCCTCTIC